MIKSKTAGYYMVQSLNQLLQTSVFSNAAWIAQSVTLTSGQTDPVAGTDAFTVTADAANAKINQIVQLKDGTLNRIFSIYIKRKTGTGAVALTIDGTTYTNETITGSWARYDLSEPQSGTAYPGVRLAVSGDEVYLAFAQLEDGDTPTDYDGNTTSRYTITKITDGDYPINTTRGCVFMDGYHFVMTPKGEICQSALENAASWSALEFIQSQNDPSDGVYIAKQGAYIAALKKWGIEFFYNAANPTGSILAPIQNQRIDIGCASEGSVQDVGGFTTFISQTRLGAGRSVFVIAGLTPQQIATPDIDKILNSDPLTNVYSWTANAGSHLLYAIVLPDSEVTLVYDIVSKLWSFFTLLSATETTATATAVSATGVITSTSHPFSEGDIVKVAGIRYDIDGWYAVLDTTDDTFTIAFSGEAASSVTGSLTLYEEAYFPIVSSVNCAGVQYMQDKTTGALYSLDQNAFTDYGSRIATRAVTGKFDADTMKPKQLGQIEVIGDKVGSIGYIRWSDNDFVSSSKFRPVDMSLNRSRVRRTGSFNRRSFEFLHLSDQLVRVEALEI